MFGRNPYQLALSGASVPMSQVDASGPMSFPAMEPPPQASRPMVGQDFAPRVSLGPAAPQQLAPGLEAQPYSAGMLPLAQPYNPFGGIDPYSFVGQFNQGAADMAGTNTALGYHPYQGADFFNNPDLSHTIDSQLGGPVPFFRGFEPTSRWSAPSAQGLETMEQRARQWYDGTNQGPPPPGMYGQGAPVSPPGNSPVSPGAPNRQQRAQDEEELRRLLNVSF